MHAVDAGQGAKMSVTGIQCRTAAPTTTTTSTKRSSRRSPSQSSCTMFKRSVLTAAHLRRTFPWLSGTAARARRSCRGSRVTDSARPSSSRTTSSRCGRRQTSLGQRRPQHGARMAVSACHLSLALAAAWPAVAWMNENSNNRVLSLHVNVLFVAYAVLRPPLTS